jgi:hypothetical protein
MKEMPSFGAKVNGVRPSARRAGPAGTPVGQRPLTDKCECDVTERGEVTARTDTSLLRHRRHEAAVDERHQGVDQFRPDTAGGAHQHVGAKYHHRAHHVSGHQGAHTRSVTANEVDLQLLQLVGRNPDIRQLAEAGVDAIHRGAGRHRGFHPRPARGEGCRAPGATAISIAGSRAARTTSSMVSDEPSRIRF